MLRKSLLYTLPLLTAAGPVAYYSASDRISGIMANYSAAAPEATEKKADAAPAANSAQDRAIDGSTVVPLEEAFRFEVTPAWVITRWPRVSSGLGLLQLQGYRVALVTGGSEDDLAGALSYYFDHQQLQRITFQGSTGDYRRLSQLLTSHYGFTYRPANTPGVFILEGPSANLRSKSFLWIQPSPLLKAEDRFKRFDVSLVLDRPGA